MAAGGGTPPLAFDDLVSIFSHLAPRDLCSAAQVSHAWHEASMVGSLWKKHCFQRWNFCNLSNITPGQRTWQKYYQSRYKIDVGVSTGRPGLDYACKTLRGHKGLVTDVIYITGNDIYNEDIIEKNACPIVASCSADKSVALWNAREGKKLWSKADHDAHVSCLAVIESNKSFASGDLAGSVRLWDVQTAQSTHLGHNHESGITSLVSVKNFSDHQAGDLESVLLSSSTNGVIHLWDVRVPTEPRHTLESSLQIHLMELKAGYLLATASKFETSVKVFDLRLLGSGRIRGPEVATIQHTSDATVNKLCWLPRKQDHLAVGYKNGDLIVWDVANGQEIHSFVGHTNSIMGVSTLGSNMVSAGSDGSICLWDVDSKTPLQTFNDHTGPITGLYLDSYRVITCSRDFSIRTYRWVKNKDGSAAKKSQVLESCYTLLGGSLQRAGNGFEKITCDYSSCVGMANDVLKAYSFQV